MVEVKSSTSVKPYHRDDAAIQAFVVRSSGVQLSGVTLAQIDSDWIYPGAGDYTGLLRENDITEEALGRGDEVRAWISEAQHIVAGKDLPEAKIGKQCLIPYECCFQAHCQSLEPQAVHPIRWSR